MKKSFILMSFCALAVSASAQFKVLSNGKIAIQTTSTAQSPISINSAGNILTILVAMPTEKTEYP